MQCRHPYCRLGRNGLDQIGLALQWKFDDSQGELACVSLDETARQRRNQIGAEMGEGHHERRHGQDNAALEAALCQEFIDEAAWIAVERYEEVLSPAECGERRCAGKHVGWRLAQPKLVAPRNRGLPQGRL